MVGTLVEAAPHIDCGPCPFCTDLPNPKSAFDATESLIDNSVTVTPALGMMLPGYFLAISKEHQTSFAQFPTSTLREVDLSLSALEQSLTPFFGEYVRVESGSDNRTPLNKSGSCIDHAHQHLVPAADLGPHMLNLLDWEQLDAYEDIAQFAGRPYIYLGQAGLHHIVSEPNLSSQWMRRQLADIRSLASWDWGIDPNQENLEDTVAKLRGNGVLSTLIGSAEKLLSDETS